MSNQFIKGLSTSFRMLQLILIVALINTIASFCIGLRKKDCLTVFITNILTKSIALFVLIACPITIIGDDEFLFLYIFLPIVFFITIIGEGLIYKKVLNNREKNGIAVSLICNMAIILPSLFMGILDMKLGTILTILAFAFISMFLSLIIGLEKKDYLAIFIINIIVKAITLSSIAYGTYNFFDELLMPIMLMSIIEGIIYRIILKFKKNIVFMIAMAAVFNVISLAIVGLVYTIIDCII